MKPQILHYIFRVVEVHVFIPFSNVYHFLVLGVFWRPDIGGDEDIDDEEQTSTFQLVSAVV